MDRRARGSCGAHDLVCREGGDYSFDRQAHARGGTLVMGLRHWTNISIRARLERRYYRKLWQETIAGPAEYPSSRFKGRGLVMSLSPEVSFEKLWVNLCVLRRVLKCDLPIELWLFGQPDIKVRAAPLLEDLSVCILGEDALPTALAGNAWSGHAAKALSIAHSSFEDVLFLDVDTCPVRDPASLFDELAYRWSGAIFWPDILRTDPASGIWPELGLAFVDEPQWRGSQLVVNKARSWRPLCLLDHLTRHHGFYDPHTRDGKLAFYAAWKALDHPYAMTRQAPGCVGAHDGEGHLNQCDLRGQLLFQGRGEAGWAPPLGNTDAGAHFVHREACAAFAQELRERWPQPQRRPQQAPRATRERPSWRHCLQPAPRRTEAPAERP